MNDGKVTHLTFTDRDGEHVTIEFRERGNLVFTARLTHSGAVACAEAIDLAANAIAAVKEDEAKTADRLARELYAMRWPGSVFDAEHPSNQERWRDVARVAMSRGAK